MTISWGDTDDTVWWTNSQFIFGVRITQRGLDFSLSQLLS
jgi:hypothetical protein